MSFVMSNIVSKSERHKCSCVNM